MADETPAPPATPQPTANGAPGMVRVDPDPGLASKSDDDIAAMLNALRDSGPEPPKPQEPIDMPPEPAEAAPAEPVAVEPEKPAEPVDDPLEDLRLSLQEEGLRREKLEAQLQHEKLLREQSNTRTGTYKKLATDLLRDGRTPPPEDPEYTEDTPASRELGVMQQELAMLREEANTRASNEVLQAFVGSTPDLANDTEDARQLLQDMQPHVRTARQEHAELLDSGNPRLVRETTKLILKTAYVEAKAARLSAEREAAKTRRAEQFAALGKAKAAAAISGAGTSAPARPRQKTPSEMTADEADAALRRMTAQ